MLILTRRKEERVIIGDDIKIMVVGISENSVRLGFDCPREIPVYREEIYEARLLEKPKEVGNENS